MAGFTAVKKNLAHLATVSECGIVEEWTKSIINHLYWCSASVPNSDNEVDNDSNGNGDEVVKHWKSLMDHLCNIHDNCYHRELSSLK